MAWLLTLARSRAFDHLRRRDAAVTHPEPETLVEAQVELHDSPAHLRSNAQRDQCLSAALEQLDPLPRQLLALAFYRGLTHDEIAQQTQLPLGTVKSHVRRALASMREALTESDNTQLGPTT